MTQAQIKFGIVLLIAQLLMLAMTLGFNSLLDRQAAQDGIATIIQEAAR
jgi:hypothetical protein